MSIPEKNENQMDLFVYGSLKKGLGNHDHFLKQCTFLGEDKVHGVLLSLGGFPGLLLEENGWEIKGEVYRINKELDLPSLDRLEHNGSMYSRKEVETEKFGKVWTYEYNYDTSRDVFYRCVPSGNWTGTETATAKWIGVFSKNRGREYQSSFGLFMDEDTGFRAVMDMETGEIVTKGGIKKPHLSYDGSIGKWVPIADKKPAIVLPPLPNYGVAANDSRNHGDLYRNPPQRTNLFPKQESYKPYVDRDDPGEEPA